LTVDNVPIRFCDCGTALSWVWESEAQYEDFYAGNGFHFEQQSAEGFQDTIERESEHLFASRNRIALYMATLLLNPSCSILDVGAGGGAFIEACKDNRLNCIGIEPCKRLVDYAHTQARLMDCGTWKDVRGSYDLITLHDVLEHLTRPLDCLKHLKRCLKPNGAIVVEMPELYSEHHYANWFEWRHFRPKQHVCLYSRWAAEKLFDTIGLTMITFHRPMLGRLGKATYILRDILRDIWSQ